MRAIYPLFISDVFGEFKILGLIINCFNFPIDHFLMSIFVIQTMSLEYLLSHFLFLASIHF